MSESKSKTFACAHRGDSSRFRENTIIAIQSAIDAGAEVVEIDVRITRDGKVIVLHDSNLERLWGITKESTKWIGPRFLNLAQAMTAFHC